MSRIILSRYDTGEEHIVVGFDRPLDTYYWQEFNKEPADWDSPEAEGWEEMIGFAGYSMRELPELMDLLNHAATHNHTVFNTMQKHEDTLIKALERHKTLEYPQSNETLDFS